MVVSNSPSTDAQARIPLLTCVLAAFGDFLANRSPNEQLEDYRRAAAALATLKDNRFFHDTLERASSEDADYTVKQTAKGIIASKIHELLPGYNQNWLELAASHALGAIAFPVDCPLFKTDSNNIRRVVQFLVYHVGHRDELITLLEAEYGRMKGKPGDATTACSGAPGATPMTIEAEEIPAPDMAEYRAFVARSKAVTFDLAHGLRTLHIDPEKKQIHLGIMSATSIREEHHRHVDQFEAVAKATRDVINVTRQAHDVGLRLDVTPSAVTTDVSRELLSRLAEAGLISRLHFDKAVKELNI